MMRKRTACERCEHCGGPGTAQLAVAAYLSTMQGAPRDIAAATGYSNNAVEQALMRLRALKSPLLANVLDGRTERHRAAREARAAALERQKARQASGVATQALHSRSALEEAWR